MNYEPNITHESAACPGVTFTVKRFSVGMRTALRKRLEYILIKLRAIARDRADWLDEVCATTGIDSADMTVEKLSKADKAKFEAFVEQEDYLQVIELDPAHFDAGFVSIAGLTIAGEMPNAERLRDEGPPDLVHEILGKIREGFGLTAEQKANLESPTTLAAPADGQTSDTSAATASANASTSSAIAGDTSLDR